MALVDEQNVTVINLEQITALLNNQTANLETVEQQPLPATIENKLCFHSVGQLTRAIEPIDWLIEDFIEADTMALCFAPPASFKSFFAVDIASSIATGTNWHDCEVKQGAVFYIAGEGLAGLKKRFRAWEIARGVSTEGHPLYLSSGASDLLSLTSVSELIRLIAETSKQIKEKPRLIVIDTLARNFGGGNENDTKDMNRFVSNVDAIRNAWGCTVLVVHHTGHSSNDRGRGSSALKAALDAEYQLTRQEDSKLVCIKNTKMKDAESPTPKTFELLTVELGKQDHKGREITSAVLVNTDKEFVEASKPKKLTANHEALLQAVRSRNANQESTAKAVIRDDLKAQGLNVNAFGKWIKKLVDDGLLIEKQEGLYPVVNG